MTTTAPHAAAAALELLQHAPVWNRQIEQQQATQQQVADPEAPAAGDTPPAPAAEPAPAAAVPSPPVPTPPAGAQAAPATETPAEPAGEAESIDGLPEWAQREIKKVRRENQTLRSKTDQEKQAAADAAKTELAQTIGKALGLVEDDTPTDPQELIAAAQQREQAATAAARAAQVTLAVYSAAPSKTTADLLLDSRTFEQQLADLDPTASDFQAQVAEKVKDAIAANPARYATEAPAAPASTGGAPHTGGAPQDTDSIDAHRRRYAESRSARP